MKYTNKDVPGMTEDYFCCCKYIITRNFNSNSLSVDLKSIKRTFSLIVSTNEYPEPPVLHCSDNYIRHYDKINTN